MGSSPGCLRGALLYTCLYCWIWSVENLSELHYPSLQLLSLYHYSLYRLTIRRVIMFWNEGAYYQRGREVKWLDILRRPCSASNLLCLSTMSNNELSPCWGEREGHAVRFARAPFSFYPIPTAEPIHRSSHQKIWSLSSSLLSIMGRIHDKALVHSNFGPEIFNSICCKLSITDFKNSSRLQD